MNRIQKHMDEQGGQIKSEKRNTQKLIYILKCDRFYKIGYTDDLSDVIAAFELMNPHGVFLVCAKKTIKYTDFLDWVLEHMGDSLYNNGWFLFNWRTLDEIRWRWFK